MEAIRRDEHTTFSFSLPDPSGPVACQCLFLMNGVYIGSEEKHFEHPAPAFNRLFLFYRGGCRVRAEAGSFTFAPRRFHLLPVAQDFDVTYAAGSVFAYFHFSLVHLTSGLDVFEGIRAFPSIPVSRDQIAEMRRWHTRSGAEAALRWQPLVFHSICRLAHPAVGRLLPRAGAAARHTELLAYIQAHCHPAMTVEDLARRQHVSRSSLSRNFHRDVGVTLKEYMTRILVQRAKDAVAAGDKTIQQVAHELGYEDPYYFHRFFKKQTGQTPMAYRKAMRSRTG